MLQSKLFRAFRHEIYVWAFAEHFTRSPDRISNMFNTTDASSTKGCAVHDQRVELDLSLAIQETPAASVEGFIVFHDDDSFFFNCVERGAATFKNTPADSQCIAHAAEMRFNKLVRNRPRAAVDEKGRMSSQAECLEETRQCSIGAEGCAD